MQESDPCFPLLSLPDLPLQKVMNGVSYADRHALARSCRRLANVVSSGSRTQLSVTPRSLWAGLSKVLVNKTIICQSLRISGNVADDHQPGNNALHVLLKQQPLPDCSFNGIKKVFIHKAHPLPCLLPPNIAHVLPDLEELHIRSTPIQYADLQPLPYCSSLREITFAGGSEPWNPLPNKYHTAQDLQQKLPNISSISISTGSSCCNQEVDTLLYAWHRQLTKLEISTYKQLSNLQHCTRLQSLKWYIYKFHAPLVPLPPSLVSLQLIKSIQESDLETILQLPLLCHLSFLGFESSLQRTWSHHNCKWQQLTIRKLHMVDLGKLPLHSLNGKGCLQVEALELPDPESSNSLPDVAYAVRCVGNAGIIVECCGFWVFRNKTPELDLATAELIRTASRVVYITSYRSRVVHLKENDAVCYPQTTAALILSFSQSLECVSMPADLQPVPWLWQALQDCTSLEEVCFYACSDDVSIISMHVQMAIGQLAAVTREPLRFEIAFTESDIPEEDDQANIEVIAELQKLLPSSLYLQYHFWDECALTVVFITHSPDT